MCNGAIEKLLVAFILVEQNQRGFLTIERVKNKVSCFTEVNRVPVLQKMAEFEYESISLVKPEAFVYHIPPRPSTTRAMRYFKQA